MHRIFQKIEEYNRKLIPWALVALLLVIIIELFFHIENPVGKAILQLLDWMVIAIFAVDLIFLAIRSKNSRFFFRNYWLDILAVFPFALVFNLVEQVYRSITAAERIVLSQAIFHEGLEAEKLLKEGAKETRLVRMLRVIPRGLRFLAKSHLFEKFRKKRGRKHQKRFIRS